MKANEVEQLKKAFVSTLVNLAKQIPETATHEQIVSVTLAVPHVEEVVVNLITFLE
jgi:hypothetical protein